MGWGHVPLFCFRVFQQKSLNGTHHCGLRNGELIEQLMFWWIGCCTNVCWRSGRSSWSSLHTLLLSLAISPNLNKLVHQYVRKTMLRVVQHLPRIGHIVNKKHWRISAEHLALTTFTLLDEFSSSPPVTGNISTTISADHIEPRPK